MTRIRSQRAAEQMKKEIAGILGADLKDPRIGFATVTKVDLSDDLQYGKVYVSVFGDEETKRASLAALERAKGYIRGEVGRRLRLRVAPELAWRLDESEEYSAHIESVLRSLHQREGDAADTAQDGSDKT